MQEIKEYVKERKENIKEEIDNMEKKPLFAIIQIGSVEESNIYVRNKIKDCNQVGIKTELFNLPENVSAESLKQLICSLNDDDNSIDAIMVQFPLPKHLDKKEVMSWINPNKDADGFTDNGFTNPATPQGIITYLERNRYSFEDQNALVIGRSEIVGKPMAKLLLEKNCNVTVIHSKTSFAKKRKFVKNAELIICAADDINVLTNEYPHKEDVTIFDVGIKKGDDGKLHGNCEPNIKNVSFQSPVPGGVGLLTRLQLLENIIILYKRREK